MAKVLDINEAMRRVNMGGKRLPELPMVSLRKKRGDGSKYGKRHVPGQMNQTELAYAKLLVTRKLFGDVIDWKFEAITFKLANNCRYTPDFLVMREGCPIEFVDAKGAGPIDPKSLVKIKVAAESFPMFRFAIEQKQNKKQGGSWKRRDF